MKSKIISVLMCGIMVLGFGSVTAFADDNVETNDTPVVQQIEPRTAPEPRTSDNQEIEPRDSENEGIMLINETDEVDVVSEEGKVAEDVEEISTLTIEKAEAQVNVVENDYDDVIIYSLVSVVAILSMLGCYRTITLEKRINELEKKEEK